MLYTKYNFTIGLYPQKNTERQLVRIRVSSNGLRSDLYTRISLDKSQWDDERKRVKQGCIVNGISYNILNSTLDEYSQFIQAYFNECVMKNVVPSLSKLKEKFNKKYKNAK